MGARAGEHHNPTTIAGDTVSGAATGAAIGSAVPGVGTAIGAGVGAAGGFLVGLFTGDSPDALPAPEAPPPPLDLADEIGKRAEIAKQARLMASGAGTFVSGPGGDTSAVPTRQAKAGY